MDKRIDTKHRPMYGCHSDLDHYRKGYHRCDLERRDEERACEGCWHQEKEGDE